jgi:GNAT superfamily N-acetyltransferase
VGAAVEAVPDPYALARSWYATTMALRATTAEQLAPGAVALRTPQWPRSYAHNALVLTEDPGAERTLELADAALAGLGHRQVLALCPLAEATTRGLRDAGYEVQPEVLMARGTAPLGIEPGAVVEQLDPYSDEVQVLQDRLWREEWLPGAPDETVAQLVDRRSELDRAGEAVTFVVRAGGSPVACLDVTVRDGIAELDGLATLQPYRGRGYGQALMARGVAYAADAGCELVVLTALVEDWPREWYARLGFTTLGSATEATRQVP